MDGETTRVFADEDPLERFPCGKCGFGHDTLQELWACNPADPDQLPGLFDEPAEEGMD